MAIKNTDYYFLSGGGEMSQLIRAKDWSKTPLGVPSAWPQSLRTMVAVMLDNPFGMYIAWGKEYTQLYNDGYRPILGSTKHPHALGISTRETFAEIWHIIEPMFDGVMEGKAVGFPDFMLPLNRNGFVEECYFDFSYSPIRKENGEVGGVLVTVTETTEKKRALDALKESNTRFRNTVKQAPIGITILRGPEYVVEMANDAYLQIVDRKEATFVGRPIFESLPEVEGIVRELLDRVMNTGIPFHGSEYPLPINRFGKEEISYFDFLYHPLKEDDGKISGIIVTVTDVTESVKAKHYISESEKQFRNMVMQSPIPMTIFRGKEYVIEMANKVMFEKIWRREEKEVVGKKLLEAFPELKDQKYPGLLDEVYATGKVHGEKESVALIQGNNGLKKFYLDFEYSPLYEPDGSISGVMVTVNDVSEKAEARKKIEENEERLNIVVDASELGTWELNLGTNEIKYSDRYLEIFGLQKGTDVTYSSLMCQVHPDDLPLRATAFKQAYNTGHLNYKFRVVRPDKSIRWVDAKGKVFYDEERTPVRIIGTIQDITVERSQQQELEESEQKFRLLADSMPQHIWTADPNGNLNYYNQSVFDYTGLTLEDIHTVGWLDIVHPDDREENVKVWMKAVTTGKDFSFEHRFRKHTGEYRWQLSRAIPQRNEEGNIQMWVGTSTDIQDQKMFTRELERQVQERTTELKKKNDDLQKINKELQSFAYISSHDLQEPLRKIQTFSSRISEKELHNLSDAGKDNFQRMNNAANRMQTLIKDLLAYSRDTTTARKFERTDLKVLVEEVVEDMHEQIQHKHAVVEIGEMCEASIIPFQFMQLIQNLLSNSLKFSNIHDAPHIQLTSKNITGKELDNESLAKDKLYCHIRISDNGIGFEPEYSEKIFEVFQRLHGKEEYNGTGIGLAIVKKIVENHNGFITAKAILGKGATFDIYLPVEQSKEQ